MMKQLIRSKSSMAVLGLLLAFKAAAAPVTIWYGGYVQSITNPSNALPITVTAGMPFTGRVMYNGALITNAHTNTVPGGNYGVFYADNLAAFSSVFQIDGHVITNRHQSAGSFVGEIFVSNNYQGEDALDLSMGAGANLQMDGTPLGDPNVVPQRFSTLDIDLADQTQTAFDNPGLPVDAPNLAKFGKRRQMRWTLALDDGKPTELFRIVGVITVLSTNEVVFLKQQRLPNKTMLLSWPRLNSGFTLQTCTNPATGAWQNATNAVAQTALENTVAVSTDGTPRFYRLKK